MSETLTKTEELKSLFEAETAKANRMRKAGVMMTLLCYRENDK